MNLKGFILGLYSFFSLLIVIVFMFLFRKKIFSIRKIWAFSMVKFIGADINVTGKLDINADIIILNHNSMFDITLLDHIHPKDIAWVTNEKLAKVPIFGWIFKFPNLILIDPTNRRSLKILLNRAKEEVENKRPIGIFPEGTRGNNDTILEFQKGAKLLAEKLNLNVQPIVLTNTRKRLDTKSFISTPGEVKVIYLDTVTPTNKDWFDNVETLVKETYRKNI